MEKADCLIIGGGIIGTSLACELARAGQKVIVLEGGLVGCGASSAAVGLLSPTLAASSAGPLADLCYQSAAIYETWLEELGDETRGDVGFRKLGLLEILTDPQPEKTFERISTSEKTWQRRTEFVSADELRRREPCLTVRDRSAVFYADDGQVDAAALSRAVGIAAARAGVQIRENESVQELKGEAERITAVTTLTAMYQADTIVMAAGAWTGSLLKPLGISLVTFPVKGQLAIAGCGVAPVQTPIHAEEALLVPRADGLMLGVTVEEAGFDTRVTVGGLCCIFERTSALLPSVAQMPLNRAWAGLRPATPDGLPYMGPVPPWRNLWVSTGHFRKGILLAPVCAQLMARSILADEIEDDLTPFKPTRRLAV